MGEPAPVAQFEGFAEAPAWACELRGMLEQALQPRPPVDLQLLSSQEAARYVGFATDSGLRKWAKQWHVRPARHGVWNLHHLNLGLEREKRAAGRRRKGAR